MREYDPAREGWFTGSRMVVAGVAVAVLGAAPILLYGLFGPADGNPVGLGLLMMAAVPVGAMLAGLGLIRMAIEWLVKRFG